MDPEHAGARPLRADAANRINVPQSTQNAGGFWKKYTADYADRLNRHMSDLHGAHTP